MIGRPPIRRVVLDLCDDSRHAFRRLRLAPGVASLAIVTLALGIGANAAIFSVVDAALLRPLPYPRPAELYAVRSLYDGESREFVSMADFADWRRGTRAFSRMAAILGGGAVLMTPSGPEYLTGAAVSEDFFPLFGVQPVAGRTFVPGEYQPGRDSVVLVSHRLWERRFNADPAAVGRAVTLDGRPVTVIGVLPPGFAYPADVDLWRPLTLTPSETNRRAAVLHVRARRRWEVPVEAAQAELVAVARRIADASPAARAGWGATLVPLQAASTETVRTALIALWGAVGCVLLIACANLGSLLVARASTRRTEFAVRAALGAGRLRLARQLLAEAMLMALCGGVGGVALAASAVRVLKALAPTATPRLQEASLDLRALAVATGLALATGVLVGLLPVWRLYRGDLQAGLRGRGYASTSGPAHHALMRLLLAGQVALAVVLVVGASLMVATLSRLHAVPLGFASERLLTFYVGLPEARYSTDVNVRRFFETLLQHIRRLPGVQGASAINALYVHWGRAIVIPVPILGRPAPDLAAPADVHVRIVDPDLHRVLGVPIRRGRALSARDRADTPPVVVVNEAMARRHFAGVDPLGQHVSLGPSAAGDPAWSEIVGVVGDVHQGGLDVEVQPEVQVSYLQSSIAQLAIIVRTSQRPGDVVPALRAEVERLDPALPMTFVQSMDAVLDDSLATRRFGVRLLGGFSGAAALLTALGFFGLISTVVADRGREIAVRLALGGRVERVVGTVVSQTAAMALVGLGTGIVLSIGATRAIEPLLFGIHRVDATVYALAALVLCVVLIAGGVVPARRIARVDPASTLRAE